jgi:cation transport regulator ChaB
MTDPVQNPTTEQLAQWHRTFAPRAFNATWSLLDLEERTREQEEEMIASTLAQRHHWYAVGTPRHQSIADWQVSRVFSVLGYAELARRFGERALAVAKDNDLDAFVVGFAHEAIARAAAEVDDLATFEDHFTAARAQLELVEDPEDRAVLESDLNQFS